jgi:hypothetical protein
MVRFTIRQQQFEKVNPVKLRPDDTDPGDCFRQISFGLKEVSIDS